MKKVFLFLFFLLQFSFGLIELEKGEFDKLLLKFLENKAFPLELKVLKAYFQNLGVEVEEYLVYYAKGLMLERQGSPKSRALQKANRRNPKREI